MENKYMFILCPPASGSTLLHKILETSPHTSAFKVEGQALVQPILFTKDRWNPGKVIPWDMVKEKWHEKWDLQKTILLEKSPPNLVRAKQLEMHFPQSHFIIMMRNPYAFCEGVKRRWGKKFFYLNIAKLWVLCARYQIDNIKNLKNAIWFTYEDLTTNPELVCKNILDFAPELKELSPEKKFDVFEKSMNIMNLNQTQISSLSDDDIFEINLVLKKYKDYLAFFNYQYINMPVENIKFKIMKKIYLQWRSLKHLPDYLR
ncbi:MAG TPA: sulfotransferase [Candidatus Deferrimicrobium sp.]|nr:sulfotransferase [Candidatus Kapabacteria bacterium]HLP62145.1 sulfotransferase [Candidatus Deferrimicrobium sp.]